MDFDPFRWNDPNDRESRNRVVHAMLLTAREMLAGGDASIASDSSTHSIHVKGTQGSHKLSLRVSFVPASESENEIALPGIPDVVLHASIDNESLVRYRIRSTEPLITLRDHLQALRFARVIETGVVNTEDARA